MMNHWVLLFLKGVAMGAANVIPGVSGGTVAFITGIYERLINAVKSFGLEALGLLLKGKFRAFSEKVDLAFLLCLGGGIVASILTFAHVLKYLYEHYAVFVWAFFFGLILASIYFVGKKVKHWGGGPVLAVLVGTGIAVGMVLLKPASENATVPYLLLCGIIAMASMIIPGISGSFVLLLLGNYQLVMIESVAKLTSGDLSAFRVLIPVGIGAVLGVLALSHFLSWIFRRFHDTAVALLTGFVAGSLPVIWPWKHEITSIMEAAGKAKEKVIGYDWYLPSANGETCLAIGILVLGFALVWLMEKFATEEK